MEKSTENLDNFCRMWYTFIIKNLGKFHMRTAYFSVRVLFPKQDTSTAPGDINEYPFILSGANAIRTAGRMPISRSAATSVAFLLIARV